MATQTKIQWTDHTANLWWGCTEVHAGCDHCYARSYARAKGKREAWEGKRFAVGSVWSNLEKWQRAAAAAGETRRVFVGSMMDFAEKPLPASDWKGSPLGITTGDIRDRFFRETVPACPDLEFQCLTKRPGNVPSFVPAEWLSEWPRNVMTGASVVDQATADTLIPQLLKVPGRRFLSVEPLLGPIDLTHLPWETYPDGWLNPLVGCRGTLHSWGDLGDRRIHWVIVGGESGPKARPCDLTWIRSVRDQCRAAGVPVFVKQLGARPMRRAERTEGRLVPRVVIDSLPVELRDSHGGDPDEWPEDLRVREFAPSERQRNLFETGRAG